MVRKCLGIIAWALVTFPGLAVADFRVDVAEAPANNLALTVGAIQSARQSILLNIYEMTSPQIADALINRVQAGVHVEVLEEGQPVGGMSAAAKGIQAQIVQAMQRQASGCRFYVMTSKGAAGKRRYRFDHAKYAVIDGSALLIGSENYSPTGNPTPGTKGNRGWEVLIHDPVIAQNYQNVFSGDAETRDGDVIEATAGVQLLARKPPKPGPAPAPSPTDPVPAPGMTASAVARISSPDSSLSGLVSLLDQARSSVDIQQMTFDSAWSGGSNPLVAAVERASSRGVKVRVLLNDEAVFNHGSNPGRSKNQPTADHLNTLPNVSARIANLKGMGVDYIHNKGMLVDGQVTLISSINWDENSIQHNREAAVAITSRDVNAHYQALFNRDWDVSGGSAPAAETGAVAAFLPAAAAPVTDCPASVRVTARIGKLKLDSDDGSFSSIDGATITRTLQRVRGAEGCVLSSEEQVSGLARHGYMEIRSVKDGHTATFEGYTPNGDKLYSIRARIPKANDGLSGSFDALVFNGSSAHEFLGKAVLELE